DEVAEGMFEEDRGGNGAVGLEHEVCRGADRVERKIGEGGGDRGGDDVGEYVGGGGDDQVGIQGLESRGVVGQGLGGQQISVGGEEERDAVIVRNEHGGVGPGIFDVHIARTVEVTQTTDVVTSQAAVEIAVIENVRETDFRGGDGGLVQSQR